MLQNSKSVQDMPKIIEEAVKRLGGEIVSTVQDAYNISLPEEKRKDIFKVMKEVAKEMEENK
jgi:hypothetical protein